MTSTRPYPISLQLSGKRCVIVGGGAVAARKARTLLDSGARVAVVAPVLVSDLRELRERIELRERVFEPGDLEGAFLAFAATDDPEVNKTVAQEAWKAGVLVNVADQPALSDFFVPSQINRGDLQITVSTGGGAPALAKKLRGQIEQTFGHEYEIYADLVARARIRLQRHREIEQSRRAEILGQVLDLDLLTMIREGRIEDAEKEIDRCISRSLA